MPVDGPWPEIGQASFCWHPSPTFGRRPLILVEHGWAALAPRGAAGSFRRWQLLVARLQLIQLCGLSLKMNSLPQNPGFSSFSQWMWSYIGEVITMSIHFRHPQVPYLLVTPISPMSSAFFRGPHSPLVPVRWIGAICSRSSGGGKKDSHLQEPVSIATGRSTTEWESFPSS